MVKSVEDILDNRLPAHAVQNFGKVRAHARTLPRRQHHGVQRFHRALPTRSYLVFRGTENESCPMRITRIPAKLVQPPGDESTRDDFDHHNFPFLERGLAWVLRILLVEAASNLPEARSPIDENHRTYDDSTSQTRPV